MPARNGASLAAGGAFGPATLSRTSSLLEQAASATRIAATVSSLMLEVCHIGDWSSRSAVDIDDAQIEEPRDDVFRQGDPDPEREHKRL